MKLIKKTLLSDNIKKEVLSIVKLCQNFDNIHLSIPVEEGDFFYLLYDNQNLLSVLSLFFPEKSVCECSCFTRPDSRRHGYFSRLFEAALCDLNNLEKETDLDIELYFLADTKCLDTAAVLQKLDAEYEYSEYMMEYQFESALQPPCESIHLAFYRGAEKNPVLPENLESEMASDHILCLISDDSHGQTGQFYLSLMGEKTAYFFGFLITEEFRGQGMGYQSLINALHILKQASIQKTVLQVSGDNEAACSLYKKTGFQTTETLSYYYY